ncbi:MAG: ERF family protein [Pusillimonas sp.]
MTTKVSAAFVKAQAEIEKACKDRTNPHFRSKYADLGAVVDAIKPALEKNGLAFMQKFHHDDKGITVETIIIHESGETLSNGTLNVPASKMDAQGFGSACTYARRYSLQAAFGVAPEDDDGNAASQQQAQKPAKPPAISDERLSKAIETIIAGEYTTEKLRAAFTLTAMQEKKLQAALTESQPEAEPA